MLWKDGIHLTYDGTKILVANVWNYLNINLENTINFNVGFHNSVNDMLDWQKTSKAKSLCVDTYIEVDKTLDNKVAKKILLGACKNSLKATDCFSVIKKTRTENTNNVIIGKPNISSLPKKFKFNDLKGLVTGKLDILIIRETNFE